MNALQTHYTELQATGRVPVYCYKQATVELDKADNVQIVLGYQPATGRFLYMDDLDSHKPGQNAAAAKAAIERQRPEIAGKMVWIPTPRGFHAFYESYKKLPTGRLYDDQG